MLVVTLAILWLSLDRKAFVIFRDDGHCATTAERIWRGNFEVQR